MRQDDANAVRAADTESPDALPKAEFEPFPDAMQPFFALGTKLHSEWLTLCSRRARAWIDWPVRLCGCSSIEDLAAAQTEYLRDMQEHYGDYCAMVLPDAPEAESTSGAASEPPAQAQEAPQQRAA